MSQNFQESQDLDDPPPMDAPSSQSQSQHSQSQQIGDNDITPPPSEVPLSQASAESSSAQMVVPVDPNEIDIPSDDEFTPNSQLTSTPSSSNITHFFVGKVKIDVVPLTQEQITSDPRYYLRDFFTLYVDQPRFKYYICTQCKGRVWANKTTLDHFRRHLNSGQDTGTGKGKKKVLHSKAMYDAFEKLVAARRTNKRFFLNAADDDTDDAAQPKKKGKVVPPVHQLHQTIYSQTEYELDMVKEIVMQMLPFDVSLFIFYPFFTSNMCSSRPRCC
jgi:hypothetical protein